MRFIDFALRLGHRLCSRFLVPLMARITLRRLRQFEAHTLEAISKALRVNKSEAMTIYRRGAESFAALGLDFFFMTRLSQRTLQRALDSTQVCGVERLVHVLALGRPVLIITMHMGNFPLGFLKLVAAVEGKRKVFAFKANSKNTNEDSLFAAFRHQSQEIEALYAGEEGGKRAFLELRKGNIVAMMVDFEVHVTSRANVTFFDQTCQMQTGPATLSVLSRAIILPIINFNNGNGQTVVQIEPPLFPEKISPAESNQQAIVRLTQDIARLMESWIRIDPSQVQAWTGIAETLHRSGPVVPADSHLPSTMKPVTQGDISWMIQLYRNRCESSYVVLSSIHGYSESELRAALPTTSSIQVMNATETGGLLLSVHDIDTVQGQARLQICAERTSDGVADFLRHLMETRGLRRLYSYVFAHEDQEIRILTALGFVREAVFREHIFLAGAYSDIVVYGLLEVPK